MMLLHLKRKRKITVFLLSVFIFAVIFNAVNDNTDIDVTKGELILSTTESETTLFSQQNSEAESETESYTYIFLSDDKTAIGGKGAYCRDNQITITQSGTYMIKGNLSNGRIYVNSHDEVGNVILILSGAAIHCNYSAPIYIEKAGEAVIYLKEGTVNMLSDSTDREMRGDALCDSSAAVYSKEDLTFSGKGTLSITARYNKGIFSKGDIDIKSAAINILSADDGIRSKEKINIESGEISITCSGDGIRTSASGGKSDITIYGGKFEIASLFDGVDSEGNLVIEGGEFKIITGTGSIGNHSDTPDDFMGQQNIPSNDKEEIFIGKNAPDESSTAEQMLYGESTEKALKSNNKMEISTAVIEISSEDDGIYCDRLIYNGANMLLKSDKSAVYCETEAEIISGEVNLIHCLDGIVSKNIKLNGGSVVIDSCGDGIKAVFEDDGQITLNGAYVYVDSEKTALICGEDFNADSGEIFLFASDKKQFPIINCGEFNVESGTVLAVGNGKIIADEFEYENDVITVSCNISKEIIGMSAIAKNDGENIIGFRAPRKYTNVFFTSNKLAKDEDYSIYKGVTFGDEGFNGIYTSRSYTGGKFVKAMKQ